MGTSRNNFSQTTRAKKNLVAALIVAFASVFVAVLLSVTAFATGIGEDVLNFVFGDQGNISKENAEEVYPFTSSSDLRQDGNGEENAETATVTVLYHNNYTDVSVMHDMAPATVETVNKDEAFTLEAGIDSAETPEIIYDRKNPIKVSFNYETNKIEIEAPIGISNDVTIEAKYGWYYAPYKIHNYYENPDGTWSTWTETDGEGYVGDSIPSAEDIAAGLKDKEDTFEFDGVGGGSVSDSGDAVASCYYRRHMVDVNFDANDGVNGPGYYSLRIGSIIPKAEIDNKTPLRAGYTFDGWFTAPEGGSEVVIPADGLEVPVCDDNKYTLYAHWNDNPETPRWMTIVYWGQNAEVSDDTEVKPEDYSYISEAYVSGVLNTEFDISEVEGGKYLHPYIGGSPLKPDSPLRSLDYLDPDGTGEDVPIGDCYYIQDGDHPATFNVETFAADNYGVVNVYLERKTYQWDFRNASNTETIGSITARWNQDILEEYKQICHEAWSATVDAGPWICKKVTVGTITTTTSQYLFTHMNRVDRIGAYNDEGTGGYQRGDVSTSGTKLKYYLQNVGAPDEHANIQANADSPNYTKYITILLDHGTSQDRSTFSQEEIINIEGFDTPIPGTPTSTTVPYYSNDADAFKLEQQIYYNGGGSTYADWSLFYKRAEHILQLYQIDGGNDQNYFNIGDNTWGIDYQTKIGDVPVPEGVPGNFVYPPSVEHNRQLRYFIPINSGFGGKLDQNLVFNGWALNNAVGSEKVDLDSLYMPNSDLTLYAKWSAPEVSVTFNQVTVPKTEEIASSVVLEGIYNQKLKAADIPEATDFSKDNFYFEYWYYKETDAQGVEHNVYFNPLTMTLPAHDLVLFPEYSSTIMETEYSITPICNPDTKHGEITPSKIVYAVNDTPIRVNGNTITIFNAADTDETLTATGLTDETGHYLFSKWLIDKGEGWVELTNDTKINGSYYVSAEFVRDPDGQYAEVTQAPVPMDPATYSGEQYTLLSDGGTAENGTMVYAVSPIDEQPALSEFTSEIPTGIDAGSYYIYYFARGNDGFYGSEVGMVYTDIYEKSITVKVKFTTTNKLYSGNQIVVKDSECYSFVTDEPMFNPQLCESSSPIYVYGTDVGTYTGTTWTESGGFDYLDKNLSPSFICDEGPSAAPVLNIVENAIEIPVPTWKAGSLTYNGQPQFPNNSNYWNNFDPRIMGFGSGTDISDAGTYTTTININDSTYVFPGGVTSAQVEWTIDKLDMTIKPYGIVVYKDPVAGQDWIRAEHGECFEATAEPTEAATFFDKSKLSAWWDGEELYMEAKVGNPDYSDFLDKYEWVYDDANINPTFNFQEKDYSTLVIGSAPSITEEPVKADDFNADGNPHSAFKSAGQLDDPENYVFYYAVSTTNEAPAVDSDLWKASIAESTVTNAGTYYVWYAVCYNNAKHDIAIAATSLGQLVVSGAAPVTLVDDPVYTGNLSYTGDPVSCYHRNYWGGVEFSDFFVVDGESTSAIDVGTHYVKLTPKEGFAWKETGGTTEQREFPWTIEMGTPSIAYNPVLADGFVYDDQEHQLITDEAQTDIKVIVQYGITKNTIEGQPSEWFTDISSLKGVTPGYYYIWLKVDETDNYYGIEPTLVMVDETNPDKVACDGACYYVFYEEGSGYELIIADCPAERAFEIEGEGCGFIPVNKEYSSVSDVPWHNYMDQITIVAFDEFDTWVARSGFKYISNWFNGASQLRMIAILDDSVFNNISTSVNVFTGCTSLVGGNGTVYDSAKTGSNMAKFDYAGQEGYLMMGAIYYYDGNGAEIETQEGQMIPEGKSLTVTGVNNYFAPKTPVWEGHEFLGWTLDDPAGTNYIASDSTFDTTGLEGFEHTFYAQWQESGEKPEQEISFDVSQNVHAGEFGRIEASGFLEKPDMLWSIKSGDDIIQWDSTTGTYIVAFKGLKAGTAVVNFHLDETETYAATDAEVEVVIDGKAHEEITFDHDEYSVTVGGHIDVKANGLSESRRVYWEIDDGEEYASVSYNTANPVMVNGLANGNALLKITAEETKDFDESVATVSVKVSGKSPQNLTFDKQSLTLDVWQTGTVKVSGIQEGASFEWAIEDSSLASIESDVDANPVIVKGLSAGSTKLIITTAETSTYAQTTAELPVVVNVDDHIYLENNITQGRSIFDVYSEAVSFSFIKGTPQEGYVDSIPVDVNHVGLIKAYKYNNPDGTYKVVVASSSDIASSETSCLYMFNGFSKLQHIEFNNFSTVKATTMAYMFANCPSLLDLDASCLSTLSIGDESGLNYMFENDGIIFTITFGSLFNIPEGIYAKGMFKNCQALKNIVVVENSDWTKCEGTEMFKACYGLFGKFGGGADSQTRAYIGEKDSVKGFLVTSATEDAVYLKHRGADGLSIINKYNQATSVSFSTTVPTSFLDSIIIDIQNQGKIKAYKLDDGNGGYKVIIASNGLPISATGDSLRTFFSGFSKLKSVDLSNLLTDDASNLAGMFWNCTSLTQVDLTNMHTQNVNTPAAFKVMFEGCTNLTTILIGDGFIVGDGVDLSYMFNRCKNLVCIQVPEGTDWVNANGFEMFGGCQELVTTFGKGNYNQTNAHVGETDTVGYFVTASVHDKVYLKNRGSDGVSIINQYKDATSVVFSETVPSTSLDSFAIDAENLGKIKAYKLDDGNNGYKVVIASDGMTIAANSESLRTLFSGFSRLKSVDFGNLDTEFVSSLAGMFWNCNAIEEVDLSTFNTQYCTTSKAFYVMFEGCTNLTTVTFGDGFIVNDGINTAFMFNKCSKLRYIVVPEGTDWTGSSGVGMFGSCAVLEEVFGAGDYDQSRAHIGNGGYFVTSIVEDDAYLKNRGADGVSILNKYKGATDVTFATAVPSGSIESMNVDITDIGLIKAYKLDDGQGGYKVVVASDGKPIAASPDSLRTLFSGFSNLKSFDFGPLKTNEATNFAGMFWNCTSLTSADLTNLDASASTSFKVMFEGCTNLNTVVFGNKLVIKEGMNIQFMFSRCAKLANIVVPAGTDWTNANGTDMFAGCSQLFIEFGDGACDQSRAHIGNGGVLVTSIIEDTVYLKNRGSDGVSIINKYNEATSVSFSTTIPSESLESIVVDNKGEGTIKAYKVDNGSGGYSVVVASNGTQMAAGPESLVTLFSGFSNLTSFDLGPLKTNEATNFAGMFWNCTSLTTADLTNFDASASTSYKVMFEGCTVLETVKIGSLFKVKDGMNIQYMFSRCAKLTNIIVPEGTDWAKANGLDMFAGCSKLIELYGEGQVNQTRAHVGDGGFFVTSANQLYTPNNQEPGNSLNLTSNGNQKIVDPNPSGKENEEADPLVNDKNKDNNGNIKGDYSPEL